MIAEQANKIVKEIVEATQYGSVDYVAAVNNGEVSLSELFDRVFAPAVRRRVYQELLLVEETRG
jgi:hypothetical protein